MISPGLIHSSWAYAFGNTRSFGAVRLKAFRAVLCYLGLSGSNYHPHLFECIYSLVYAGCGVNQ